MPLTSVSLGTCSQLTDVSPLADMKELRQLILPPNAKNFEFLRRLPKLGYLSYAESVKTPTLPDKTAAQFWKEYDARGWLWALQNSGISVKSSKQLPDGTWELDLSDVKLRDLAPLQGAPVSRLNLSKTAVADLAPLSGMSLTALNLDNTQVSDLSPLKGMPLKTLSLRGTRVTDLSPLRGMNLTSLLLINCRKLTDLSSLAECRELTTLTLPPNAKDVEFLRTLPKIERLSFQEAPKKTDRPDKSVAEFWKEYDAKKKR